MEYQCERCGYPAPTKERLIKHVKDGAQCRPLISKISLQDLLYKLQPPTPPSLLTCQHCNLQCKSKGGLTLHLKHCKQKNCSTDQNTESNDANAQPTSSENVASTSKKTTDDTKGKPSSKHIYFHKNVVTHKALHPFTQDIEWGTFEIENSFFLDCLECKAHGIIELFSYLHRHPNHDNIKWSNNKLVIFNGKGWVESSEPLLVKHLGRLYSILEEKWFDYQSNIRCGIIEHKDALEQCIQEDIDKFIYENIVDDDSVFFHCKDILYEYLDTMKD
jgi:hypothetical protein